MTVSVITYSKSINILIARIFCGHPPKDNLEMIAYQWQQVLTKCQEIIFLHDSAEYWTKLGARAGQKPVSPTCTEGLLHRKLHWYREAVSCVYRVYNLVRR